MKTFFIEEDIAFIPDGYFYLSAHRWGLFYKILPEITLHAIMRFHTAVYIDPDRSGT
jgi:hypothetical protein